jgi:Tol biopolymer transport system component
MTSPSTRRRLGVAGAAVAALVAPLALALPADASSTRNEIVYTADDDGDGVYSIVLRDLETRRSAPCCPADPTAETLYDDPELSPNGAQIAFSTDRGAAQYDEGIAVVNRDGSGFRRVTTPPAAVGTTYAIDVAPAWSPDGSRLLFTRITTDAADSAEHPGLDGPLHRARRRRHADAAAGRDRRLPRRLERRRLAGRVHGARRGRRHRTDHRRARRRHPAPRLAGAEGLMPTWSPDDTTIAFARITSPDPDRARQQDVAQIATVPVAGGPVTTLAATRPTSARTVAGYPSWAPDGQSLFFDLFGYSATDDFPRATSGPSTATARAPVA